MQGYNLMVREQSNITKYIAGYVVGLGIFIILIPYGIFYLSSTNYNIFGISIILSKSISIIISSLLFTSGIVFVIWSNIFLLQKGKGGPTDIFGVTISPRTNKLVITGPYRFSRNPMVFGTFSTYFSIAVYFNSLGALLILIVFLMLVITYLKLTEEKRLLNDFGDEYTEYKKNTSMIIPLPWEKGKKRIIKKSEEQL